MSIAKRQFSGSSHYAMIRATIDHGEPDLHTLICSRCGHKRELDVARKLPGTDWLCPDCKDVETTEPVLDDVFGPTVNVKHDRLLRGLIRAGEVWRLTPHADRKERMVMAHELHVFEMFSLNQLAKICRLSVPTVCRKLTKNATGGRFQPEVLSSLVYIRKVVITGERLPASIIRTAVSSGTSVSTIARLTGASETTLYIKAGSTNSNRSAA